MSYHGILIPLLTNSGDPDQTDPYVGLSYLLWQTGPNAYGSSVILTNGLYNHGIDFIRTEL